jgi:hypothetical protein
MRQNCGKLRVNHIENMKRINIAAMQHQRCGNHASWSQQGPVKVRSIIERGK